MSRLSDAERDVIRRSWRTGEPYRLHLLDIINHEVALKDLKGSGWVLREDALFFEPNGYCCDRLQARSWEMQKAEDY